MRVRSICWVVLSLWAVSAQAATINLATAGSFAVLAGSAITNTGPTIVHGDMGIWPGTAITGFPPGSVTGTTHPTDAVALQAQSDLTAAYTSAQGQPCGSTLTGQDLGGKVLTQGVYCFASSAGLTGTLTLDAQGDPNAVFIFQIGSTLITASSSVVQLTNSGRGTGVFWQVGSSATLGTDTRFNGTILALTSISLTTTAQINCGRALARNGAVTMDTNLVSIGDVGCELSGGSPIPEPATVMLLGMGLLGLIAYGRYARQHSA